MDADKVDRCIGGTANGFSDTKLLIKNRCSSSMQVRICRQDDYNVIYEVGREILLLMGDAFLQEWQPRQRGTSAGYFAALVVALTLPSDGLGISVGICCSTVLCVVATPHGSKLG